MDQAAAAGYNVIVMPGYMFAKAIVDQAELYPDVKFIGIDVSAGDILEKGVGEEYDYNPDNWNVDEYYNKDNVYCCTYQEEISGYMAGYAAVNITATMDTWYSSNGVEVVFACGGGIYTSAAEAAKKVGGKVIGVDSDQSGIINEYGDEMTITSAMKGLTPTVMNLLEEIKAGNWANYAGKIDCLGMVSENPDENYVQLPEETTVWNDGFSQDDYKNLVKSIYSGEVEISNDISKEPETSIKLTISPNIK